MSEPIIVTHTGKLGDFIYCLPVASWLAHKYNRGIHFVLPDSFHPFRYITPLLELQPFTEAVTLVPFRIANFDCGGQPYKFDPGEFGILGSYFNFGFRHYPNKYLSAFYSEEYGVSYIDDFVLHYGDPPEPSGEILKSSEGAMLGFAKHATPLPSVMDLLDLVRRLAAAKEVHSWYCGIAVLCYFARIPFHCYREKGHAAKEFFFPNDDLITWHEVVR